MDYYESRWNSLPPQERREKLMKLMKIARKIEQVTTELLAPGSEVNQTKTRRASDWPDEDEEGQSSRDQIDWNDNKPNWSDASDWPPNQPSDEVDSSQKSKNQVDWPINNDWPENEPDWAENEWPFNDPEFIAAWNKHVDMTNREKQRTLGGGSVLSEGMEEEEEEEEDVYEVDSNNIPVTKSPGWNLNWDPSIEWIEWD